MKARQAKDKQDGILDHIPMLKIDDGPAYETHPVFDMINGYEDEARQIIAAAGYSPHITDSGTIKERRIRDLVKMLACFREVRIHMWINDTEGAAASMANGIRAAMQARIRPVEPLIEIGKSRSKKQQETRSKRQLWNKLTREQITARNRKIIEHHKKTRLTEASFAQKYAMKIYGLKPFTVRLILSKARRGIA